MVKTQAMQILCQNVDNVTIENEEEKQGEEKRRKELSRENFQQKCYYEFWCKTWEKCIQNLLRLFQHKTIK